MMVRFRLSPCHLLLLLGAMALPAAALFGAPPAEVPASNRAMAETLRAVWERNQVPENPYLSSLRAQYYGQALERGLPLEQELVFRYQRITERLNMGAFEDAIGESGAVLQALYRNRDKVSPEVLLDVWRLHGMTHLRTAEIRNCAENHTHESCLFPIAGSGRHMIEEPSRQAIEVFTGLLEQFPDDLAAAYLLNIAHMTVGQYPGAVAPRFRIPEDRATPDASTPRFRDRASELGVAVNFLSGGVVMEDLDGDGALDLLVSSCSLAHNLRLFLRQPEGGFREATDEAGLRGITGGLNLHHADFDNDGDADILVLRGGWEDRFGLQPNSLLRNDGHGRFTDITREAGIYSAYPTQTAAWLDFNNDGWLDLFIGNESKRSPVDPARPDLGTHLQHHPCELYENNGDGTFRNVAATAGVAFRGYIKGVAAGDYDNDGRMDLFLSNMQGSNVLYRNLGPDASGQWRFADAAAEAGVAMPVETFPTWFWDYDNDGWLDLFISGYSASRLGGELVAEDRMRDLRGMERKAERLWLYRNRGDGSFEEVAERVGLDTVAYAMGSNYGDYNGDGWLDFYLGTGEPSLMAIVPNRLFENRDGTAFVERTVETGLGHLQKGHGIAFGDLDRDGDQDIYAVMGGVVENDVFPNALFLNPGFGSGFLSVELEGTTAPRDPFGAVIRLRLETPAGERVTYRSVTTGGSFGSSPLEQNMGLGEASAIVGFAVRWPGTTHFQSYPPPAVGARVRVVQGEDTWEPLDDRPLAFSFTSGERHHHHHHH